MIDVSQSSFIRIIGLIHQIPSFVQWAVLVIGLLMCLTWLGQPQPSVFFHLHLPLSQKLLQHRQLTKWKVK
jgi:hypothetical protein